MVKSNKCVFLSFFDWLLGDFFVTSRFEQCEFESISGSSEAAVSTHSLQSGDDLLTF